MKKVVLTAVLFFIAFSIVQATPVPDTGQTKCYNNISEIPCAQPGEPFYGQDANYNISAPSYAKLDSNGNNLPDSASSWAMVRDNVTGLIWENKTDDSSIHDKDNAYTWQDAQNVFIANLNSTGFGGFSDWRLPTIKEISYIMNRDNFNLTTNRTYFPNLYSVVNFYWASDSCAYSANLAWGGNFGGGYVNVIYKTYTYSVRAVRGNQSPQSQFIDIGDGTIFDVSTGLLWQKGGSNNLNWEDALSSCTHLNLGGYSDWRLPSINELQSIVDYNQSHPSIDKDNFPNTFPSFYWSSTTWSGDTSGALLINFLDGTISPHFKAESIYVRAVRGPLSTPPTPIPFSTTTTTICDADYWENLYGNCQTELQECQSQTTTTTVPPTLIEMSSLTATPANQKVKLEWKTETEIDNAGFNVWRAEGFQKVNPSLIPSEGSPTAGADYDFVDDLVFNGKQYIYLIEDMDNGGISTFHGPVKAVPRMIYGNK